MSELTKNTAAETAEAIRDDLVQVFESRDMVSLLRKIQEQHPSDVSLALDLVEFDTLLPIFKHILISDVSFAAECVIELEPSTIAKLYPELANQEWAVLFRELSDDDIVYLLDLFPEEARDQLVARIPAKDKEDVLELMTYPEETAGRIMTNEFVAVDEETTVEQAVERIRSVRDIDPMNLLFIYVTRDGKLVGMVSLRQLLLNKKGATVREFMHTDLTMIDVNMDQEEVAQIVSTHDDATVPVVNENEEILGIITMDDILDVISEESQEDFYLHIGSSEEEALVKHDTRKVVWLRLPWIMASFFGSLLVVFIMRYTEQGVFSKAAGRIFTFVPMISAMGGNVGVQSSTIMARYLSTNNPDWREARRSTFKEAKVGLMLGVICGIGIGGIAWIWGGIALLLTVMAAMICTLTVAAITGTIIPVLMKRLGYDPALATGPFVTSFNDFIAICVYFSIVLLFRDHLGI